MSARARVGSLLLIALMLLAYIAPWVVGRSASFTFGAYDLAEWTSLHPTVRNTSPPLLTTLLLRAPLAIIGLMAAYALMRYRPHRVLVVVLVIVLTVAQLPPLDFFTIGRGDPNHQQQFALAVVTLVGGFAALLGVISRFGLWIAAALGATGVVASGVGLAQAVALMQQFNLSVQVALGGPLLIGLFVLWVVAQLWTVYKQGKQTE
jgi:hypothetical protein